MDKLSEKYRQIFPESRFKFEVPFQTHFLGMNGEKIAEAKKQGDRPSIVFRYPVDQPGEEWSGIYGFEPQSFLLQMHHLRHEYACLEAELCRS